MASSKKQPQDEPIKKYKPARTDEDQEDVCINLAMNLCEKQLRDGTASSQIISTFVNAGSRKMKLELEKLRKENELLKAKAEAVQSAVRVEALYEDAIAVFREYNGKSNQSDEEF